MSRSERIVQQLGMSQGAAQNRLRKNILFSFAKRLKEDTCFKCNKIIETAEELSIEHKQPWEGRSVELFWDLSNIAFSHLACNVPHVRHGGEPSRKIGPEGTSWCYQHEAFLPIENFYKWDYNFSGLMRRCKECVATRQRKKQNNGHVI
jgi:hypothetical protein